MSRAECINFYKDNNFPVPAKSSCVFCPFHSDKFWRSLKIENGSGWEMSVEIDKTIRNHPKMEQRQYLSRHCKPLDQIDFQENQTNMFVEECEADVLIYLGEKNAQQKSKIQKAGKKKKECCYIKVQKK